MQARHEPLAAEQIDGRRTTNPLQRGFCIRHTKGLHAALADVAAAFGAGVWWDDVVIDCLGHRSGELSVDQSHHLLEVRVLHAGGRWEDWKGLFGIGDVDGETICLDLRQPDREAMCLVQRETQRLHAGADNILQFLERRRGTRRLPLHAAPCPAAGCPHA